MMTDDVAKIAVGLTEAQREALLLVKNEDCGALARGDPDDLCLVSPTIAVPPVSQTGFYFLTPLGLAVRAYLEKDPSDDF